MLLCKHSVHIFRLWKKIKRCIHNRYSFFVANNVPWSVASIINRHTQCFAEYQQSYVHCLLLLEFVLYKQLILEGMTLSNFFFFNSRYKGAGTANFPLIIHKFFSRYPPLRSIALSRQGKVTDQRHENVRPVFVTTQHWTIANAWCSYNIML